MSNERPKRAPDSATDSHRDLAPLSAEGGEPLVLSLDTATNRRSVAVMRGARILALVEGDLRQAHSANVLADVDEALRQTPHRIGDIDLFAVACGPGSFTGLRAGLATVKAFAATLGKPAVGVSTLHALAYAARPARRLLAMVPAGRGEVFAQLLCVDAEGRVEELEEGIHVPPSTLVERQQQRREPVKWVGGGAHAAAQLIREGARTGAFDFVEEAEGNFAVDDVAAEGARRPVWTLARPVENLAPSVAALALRNFDARSDARAEDLHAIYIRASDAELNERWRAQQSPKETHSNTSSVR